MDGSDYDETRDLQYDLGLELGERNAPLCYTRNFWANPDIQPPSKSTYSYDVLMAVVTISASVGFATLCLAIA